MANVTGTSKAAVSVQEVPNAARGSLAGLEPLPGSVPGAVTQFASEAIRKPDVGQRHLQERTEKAAGALGAYMHSNNISTVDPNQLYKLANNATGDVPPDVQKAAAFMLRHPAIYKTIETHDNAHVDGISGVGNFDAAAQGLVKVPHQIHTAPTEEKTNQAAGTLGAYMHANGIQSVDVNQLYNLANNKSGDVPPDVQKAASYMLSHPAMYRAIETNDVPGADGISGVGNFDNAAQGLVNYHPDGPRAPQPMPVPGPIDVLPPIPWQPQPGPIVEIAPEPMPGPIVEIAPEPMPGPIVEIAPEPMPGPIGGFPEPNPWQPQPGPIVEIAPEPVPSPWPPQPGPIVEIAPDVGGPDFNIQRLLAMLNGGGGMGQPGPIVEIAPEASHSEIET